MIFKFRRLLLRFERISDVHYALKTLAYTMIVRHEVACRSCSHFDGGNHPCHRVHLALPSHGGAPDRWFSPGIHGRKG